MDRAIGIPDEHHAFGVDRRSTEVVQPRKRADYLRRSAIDVRPPELIAMGEQEPATVRGPERTRVDELGDLLHLPECHPVQAPYP